MDESQYSIGDMTLIRLLNSCSTRDVSEDAAYQFCERYMEKLMSLVERNLAERFSPRLDPQDVVQSVFRSWFTGAKEGRINPGSRDEVWNLLSVVALNKVRNKVKFHDAQCRAVSKTLSDEEAIITIRDPGEEEREIFLDLVETARGRLDEMARQTLDLILQGNSVEQIATELGRTTKSVGRYKLKIREVLRDLLDKNLTDKTAVEVGEDDDE